MSKDESQTLRWIAADGRELSWGGYGATWNADDDESQTEGTLSVTSSQVTFCTAMQQEEGTCHSPIKEQHQQLYHSSDGTFHKNFSPPNYLMLSLNYSEISDSENEILIDYNNDGLRKKHIKIIDPSSYTIATDPDQGHKGTELHLSSFARPHMRAFHGSWMCFFVAFFVWFSFAPLLPLVQEDLSLTDSDIWITNICSVSGTVIMRFILGPLCDKYGAKRMMCGLLVICTVPCILSGTVNSLTSLAIARTLIGCIGGTFVPSQYWTSCHFNKNVVGSAMAFSAGWGGMGGGFAQLFIGAIIFPFCKWLTGDDSLAWRISFIFPATIAFLVAIFFFFNSDDCPLGDFKDVKKAGFMQERSAADSFKAGVVNINAWILFFQYAASFGIELTMENGAATYFVDRFDLSIETGAAIASLFGMTNLFSRGLGGMLSDKMSRHFSFRGRLIAQMLCLFTEGIVVLIFIRCQTLHSSIAVMAFFSLFVQMSCGTCFGIVPFIDATNTGSIAGIVGAGGNVGAIIFGNIFRIYSYEYAFDYMGFSALIMSLLTPFIAVKKFRGILFGKDERHIEIIRVLPV